MIFIAFLFLSIFPQDWEIFEEALNLEKQSIERAIEIYKGLSKRNDPIGILSNYKLAILDKENSFQWFINLSKKNPKKKILEETYEILIDKKNEKAIENYENFKKKFSLKFREKVEEKIFLISYENTKDKIGLLEKAIKQNKKGALTIGKLILKEDLKINKKTLKELFKIGMKFRDLDFCQKILEKDILKEKLSEEDSYLLGRFYFFKRDYNESLKYFEILKDEKSLFQKARVYLLLNEEEKAIETLKSIKNKLFNEAQYLILRINLKNGELEKGEEILKKINKKQIKSQATLNLAIHYNFYGKKEKAQELLNSLKENKEVLFWKERLKENYKTKITPDFSPFNFFYLDKFPKFSKEDAPLNLSFKPVNFPQFLIYKGHFKEGLFFSETLKFPPKDVAKIYLLQGKYRDAIKIIYPEASKILNKEPDYWNPEILRIYFPKAYEERAKILCKEYGAPLSLFWAIMRQESLFEEEAMSEQGALGVMQILPQNFIRYGEDLENPLDIEKNMRVSLKYLKELKENFGEWVYVIAAYNAGEDSISLWLKDPITIDLPSFYSTIPYFETKNYTKNVLYNWMIYKILYGENDDF